MTSGPRIFAGGEQRMLTLRRRTLPIGDPQCCSGVVGIGPAPKLLPESEWPDCTDLSGGVIEIVNQGQTNHCHSYAGIGVIETAHRLAGRADVLLSAGHLAGMVTGHRNEGAAIDQVLRVLLKSGVCKRSIVPQGDYKGPWPHEAQLDAENNKPLDVWDCGGHSQVMPAIVSCIVLGWPVELGTNAFGGGHAIYSTTQWRSGRGWKLAGPNSWGERWTNWDSRALDEFAAVCPDPDYSDILKRRGQGYWQFELRRLTAVDGFGAFCVQSTVANDADTVPDVQT